MKKIGILFLTLLLVIVFGSCTYNWIVPEDTGSAYNGGTGGDGGSSDISFSKTVEPIFTNNNNCTACHKSGGTSPDLSTGKAYASITPLINKATPESSKIYTYVSPTSSTHTHKKYTATEAATILNWIKQGAKNN